METPPKDMKVIRLVKKPPAQEPKPPAPAPVQEEEKPVTAQSPSHAPRPPRFPREESPYPRGESRYPRGESHYPRGESRYPRSESRYPRGESQFRPRSQGPPRGRRPFPKAPREPRAPRPPARPKPMPVVLTQEQRDQVINLYRAMVTAGERPPEGRRNKIAADLNIPYATVAEAVRTYIQHERLRRTNFDIEKSYWTAVRAGARNARAITEQIAQQLTVDVGRVWWWLEKLHEPRKAFATDPDVDDEQRAKIQTEYDAYLELPEPPEQGLHLMIADRVGGITPRQVHKVLWEYRSSLWQQLEGKPAGETKPDAETTPAEPAPEPETTAT